MESTESNQKKTPTDALKLAFLSAHLTGRKAQEQAGTLEGSVILGNSRLIALKVEKQHKFSENTREGMGRKVSEERL